MTATAQERGIFAVIVGEPLALAKAQPHQVLLSTGSVAIMAQYAAHSGIVAPLVGYCIALGVEWAYLRGLASDTKATTWWGDALNWSAFGIVVLWGVLWVATIYGAIDAKPAGVLAFLVAAAHVVPIAWLSLCSAMCHRAASLVEQVSKEKRLREEDERNRAEVAEKEARARKLQDAEDELLIEMRRKDAALRLMEETARRKMQLAAERAAIRQTQPRATTQRNRIIIDNIEYPSVQAAADAHGISRQAMSKRLRKEGKL